MVIDSFKLSYATADSHVETEVRSMGTKMKKVMLVDDDPDFVEASKAVLERNGYAVAVAYNGHECLEKVLVEKPDLIVLDVMMATQGEGFNVSRELRNSEQTKHIPQLMVTSINKTVTFRFEPDETWLPVDVFIDKPLEPQRLLSEVEKWLRADTRHVSVQARACSLARDESSLSTKGRLSDACKS